MTRTRRGLLAVVGSCVAIFWPGAMIFGYPGVMAAYWQETFGVGQGATGSVLFFMLAGVGTFMFFVGQWQERTGARPMVAISAVVCGLALIAASRAPSIHVIYVWAFLTGASSCFIYLPGVTVVQRWFVKRRGLASGTVNLFFGIGGAIMAPVFTNLLLTLGYEPMNLRLALLIVGTGILGAMFVESPERTGYGGGSTPVVESGSTTPAVRQGLSEGEKGDHGRTTSTVIQDYSLTAKESLRTRSFWFLWLTWALQGAAGIAMVTLSMSFGRARGFGESAALLLTAFNLTNGLSRIMSGFLSDIIGRHRTLVATFLAAACAYFVLPHVDTIGTAAVLGAIIGFSYGTLFAVSAPLVSDSFGLKHFGAIFGLVFTAFGYLSGLLGPSLSGYILDLTEGNFLPVFTYLGVFCILSAFFIRLVVPPGRDRSGLVGSS
jgi:MFS transporter, OFA family, oxalate/formate antiporter